MFEPEIPLYTKKVYSDFLNAIYRGEPTHLYGMYDGGQDYIYSLLVHLAIRKVGTRSLVFINSQQGESLEQLDDIELQIKSGDAVSVIFLLSPRELLSSQQHKAITDLRASYPWQFSYHFVGYTNVFHLATAAEKDLYLRNWTPVEPLSPTDSAIVLNVYEKFYQKQLIKPLAEQVILQSGGNPGLLKALYLQANECAQDEFMPDLSDSNLLNRLERIEHVLSDEQLYGLLHLGGAQKQNTDFLRKFGYITDQLAVFSPVFGKYLTSSRSVFERTFSTILPLQLQKVYLTFCKSIGKVVTRAEIASALWGNLAVEKYSEWAIDRAISDLRKLTIGYLSIKTLKKNGFICQK